MDICQKMNRFSFLQKLSVTSRNLINEHSQFYLFRNNKTVIQKGDRVGGVYLIQSGALRVFHINMKGQETTMYTVGSGESCILALNSVFSDIRYPAWVESVNDTTEVLVIPPAIFKCLFETEDLIKNFVFESLSRRTFQLMESLEERSTLSVEKRTLNFLLTRSNDDGEILTTQQEIANHLGSPREVVARILSGYTREGWIVTQRGKITLQNVESLRRELTSP